MYCFDLSIVRDESEIEGNNLEINIIDHIIIKIIETKTKLLIMSISLRKSEHFGKSFSISSKFELKKIFNF